MSIYLTPDNIRTEETSRGKITIKEKIIPDNARATKDIFYLGGKLATAKGNIIKPCRAFIGNAKGITVHNTDEIKVSASTTMAEQYTRATYPNCNMGGVLVHFYVSGTDIWQNLKETEQGVHAGSGNSSTIAIEVIGNAPETEETAQKLIAYLCMKYNFNVEKDVNSHNFWNYGRNEIVAGAKKNCPVWILPKWNTFIKGVEKLMFNCQSVTEPEGSPVYRVQVGAFKDKSNADKLAQELSLKGYTGFVVKA